MKSPLLRRLTPAAGLFLLALPGPAPADTPPALAAPVAAALSAPVSAPAPAVPHSWFFAALRASLPSWRPRAAGSLALPRPGVIRNAAGQEVVVLPQVTVRGARWPRLDKNETLTNQTLDAKLVHEELTDFDADFLNRFTLPILGISREKRARALYDQRQMQDALDELAFFNTLTPPASGSK